MKRLLYCSLFCLLSLSGIAQVDSLTPDLLPSNIDSIQFSIWQVYTKEMLPPGKEEETFEKELKRSTLTSKDQNIILNSLRSPDSYAYTRALQTHHNLVFHMYTEGKLSVEVQISSMTGNIDIDNKMTEAYFRNRCGQKFGKLLVHFLNHYHFIDLVDEYDLEGLVPYQEDK